MVFTVLHGVNKTVASVGGEGAVGAVAGEQHVVCAELYLAVCVLGKCLVGGTAQFRCEPAGDERSPGMVHEPLLRSWVQGGLEGSDADARDGSAVVGFCRVIRG